MLCALLHLNCDIAAVLEVLCQPDGGEVTPTKFLNDYVTIKKDLANMNGVVASDLVVRHAFIFARILVFEERFFKLFF